MARPTSSDAAPARVARWLTGGDLDAIATQLLAGREPFDPLLVVVPNSASERSLRERLAGGRALLGVTIQTAEQAALATAGERVGLRLPPGAERLVMRRLLDREGIADWPRSSGFLGTLAGALRDLFDAGLDAAALEGLRGVPHVEPRLLRLAERALAMRAELGLVDDTDLFARATEALSAHHPGRVALVGLYDPTGLQEAFVTRLLTSADEPLVCLPGHPFAQPFESRLMHALSSAGFNVDRRAAHGAPEPSTALAAWRAQWLRAPEPTPAGQGDLFAQGPGAVPDDGSLRVLATPGGQLGGRFVARHIAQALDADPELAPVEVEVVTRGAGGVPAAHLVRELLALGVPVRRNSVGAGLQATLAETALGRGLLALGELLGAPKVSRARLLDLVSAWPWPAGPVPLGGGACVVDARERSRWERLSRDTGLRTVIDGESSSRDAFRLIATVRRADPADNASAQALAAWIDRVAALHRSCAQGLGFGELGRRLAGFVAEHADPATPGFAEWTARLHSMGRFEALLDQGETASALGWVFEGFAREGLESAIVDPGGVRIGRLGARRGARARVVYLLDGDAGSFPRRRPFAVLLTDGERERLARHLPALAGALDLEAEERALFQELLELARERLVLVTSKAGLEGAGASPSPFVLETLGFLAGDRDRCLPGAEVVHDPDQALPGLERAMMQSAWSRAAGGAPPSSREAPLWVVDQARAARAASADVLAVLAAGQAPAGVVRSATVERARALAPGHSAFDGQLSAEVVAALGAVGRLRGKPELGVSASTLESFATCGMRALLGKLLGVRREDEPELGRGILHTDRGKRVHDILERLTNAALDAGIATWDRAQFSKLAELLDQAIGAVIARARKASPADLGPLWDAEEQRYRGLLLGWLRQRCRDMGDWTVATAEWGFTATRIELPDASSLYLTGIVDRVDERGPQGADGAKAVRIIDYKTGKARGKDDSTAGATALQLYLYGRAARRERGAATSQGTYDYVFHGQHTHWSGAGDALAGRELVALLGVAEAGAFWPSPRKDGKPSEDPCEFCDMRVACGPWREVALRHVAQIDPLVEALDQAAQATAEEDA